MTRFVITDLIGNPAGEISISDDGVEFVGDLHGKALLEPLQAVGSEKVMTASAVDRGDAEPSNPPGEMLIEPDIEDRYRAVNRYLYLRDPMETLFESDQRLQNPVVRNSHYPPVFSNG